MDFPFLSRKPARLTPRITTSFVFGVTALAMALLFAGCARHDGGGEPVAGAALEVPAHNDASENVKKATPVAAVEVEDGLEPSEGDIDLSNEIAVLEKSGKWGKRDKEALDMSKYDFPVVLNDPVKAYLKLFQGKQREMFKRWLARSTKYSPMIRRELAKAGLPQDLVYLSMIESGYMPMARSSAGAVGIWQFMRETGKQYTLRIDNYIDERRHIEKSTKAAVNMLGDLYRNFGDWYLAVAAYNSGPGRVQNGLARFDVENFWDLADEDYLPWETKRYVPKLIAAIIIAKDPEKYGFNDIPYQSEFSYDRLAVTPGLTLDAVALVAGCNTATIKSMNPELHRGMIPPNGGRHVVRIPEGSKDLASRNLALLRTVRDTKYRRHVVKRRENMTMVCKRYGISRASLLKANNLRSTRLTPGRTLLIPYTVTSYALGGERAAGLEDADMLAAVNSAVDTPAKVRAKAGTALHTVKSGDNVASIARRYQMTQKELLALNGTTSATQFVKKLRIGQKVKVSQDERAAASPSRIASLKTKKNKTVAAAPRQAKADKTIAKRERGDGADWYQVKNGETLWGVARKYKVSLNQIKKWNNLKSSAIHAGLRLRVSEA